MPDTSPVGVATTALVTVDASSKVSFYAGGDKIGEYPVDTGTIPAPETLAALRFGATDPDNLQPASLVIQAIYGWTSVLSDSDARLVSGNLNYAPASGSQPLPIISIPTALSVVEGNVLQIPVSKTGSGACSATIRTIAGTATITSDYTGFQQTVSLAAGDTVVNVPMTTVSDTVAEPVEGERLTVELSVPVGCTLGNARCTVTIAELPRLSIAEAVNVIEGAAASITITKIGIGACTVTWRTVAGTATLGSDYTGVAATTLSFASADTTKTVTVQTVDDAAAEQTENFSVVLENASGCTITTATCTVSILQTGSEIPSAGATYVTPVTFANTSVTGVKSDFGIGQTPYYVTSLDDTNTQGTLRHAVSASNRLILFEVGGCIKLPQTGMNVTTDNITIAGETAPSPGIIIQHGAMRLLGARNVNVRHITFERGYDTRDEADSNGDAIQIETGGTVTLTDNIWIDHCATFWTNDEAVQLWRSNNVGTLQNVSFTNSMVCEPLYMPETITKPGSTQTYRGHYEGGVLETRHNYGFLVGYGVKRVDIQHCLFTDCYYRCPFIDGISSVVLANNLALNCVFGGHISLNKELSSTGAPYYTTCVGYLKISGKDSTRPGANYTHPGFKLHSAYHPTGSKVWVTNLYSDRGKPTYLLAPTTITGNSNNTNLTTLERSVVMDTSVAISNRPIDIPTAPVQAMTAQQIYDRALLNVGPRPRDLDAAGKRKQRHLQRIIDKLRAKDGQWANHESEAFIGGFSTYSQTNRSLRNGTGRFKDGVTPIPAFPATATDKVAVRAWLRRFLDDVQYD
jgi:hypothetical protein